jgi:triphosphoribosyl-dephospho-CoA synthase
MNSPVLRLLPQVPRPQRIAQRAPDARALSIGRAATLALYDELALAPKPGLVSFVDNGSHDDMDAHTFMRSLLALRPYFIRMAELGAGRVPFPELERCGLDAERRMLAATGGVNTHRGAIFVLGLLCAAAGAAGAAGDVREQLLLLWGDALAQRSLRAPTLPGGIAAQRHGLRSASREAALGFPTLFEVALPAWREARARGLTMERVRLACFFSLLATLDDSNLAHRGGMEGLQHARQAARGFLARGGAARRDALAAAQAVHRDFVARRLSPGGCADMLAAACFLHRLAGAAA